MGLIDTTYSITGSSVTSIDTGLPVTTFVADGTQINSTTNTPYPVGTLLYVAPDGTIQIATTNQTLTPIITINSTQTWEVLEEPLIRRSLIFDRPTSFGRYMQAIDWTPINEISNSWGKLQLIVDGLDMTYWRALPTQLGSWSSNEPNGDAATTILFPQISWWERPNHGELTWMMPGKDVTIFLIKSDGSRKTLFEGLTVGYGYSGKGLGVTLDVLGVLYQADHTPYIQELYKKKRDIGTAIADILDGAISRHYGVCNRPLTGILTNIRGSGGARLTQGVQDLLGTAYTADATNQWTLTNLPGRRPHIRLKDKTTRHWTMAMGHPGMDLNLTMDFQQMIGMIWGSGTGPDGDVWYNAKYPGIRIETAPPYPLSAGAVFVAGDGHTGFDEFSNEMTTRGYSMASGDTYVAADIDEVRDAQRRAGITIDGVVGAQTWTTIFGVGGNFASLAGAHISPIAAIPQNIEYLERADGSRIGPNPSYDRTRLAIGRLVEYGEASKAEASRFARQEIAPMYIFDPMWVGSVTFAMDPENGSRWEMRAGENLFVKFMFPPFIKFGIEDGLLLHMSQVTVTPGGSVTAQLSYLSHDMTTLASIKNRNKSTIDPARRALSPRSSKISQDRIIPWDAEAGGGKIPMHNLQGGYWLTFPIPAGEIGIISETLYVCATTLNSGTLANAFISDSVLPGAKPFCFAVFSKPITANFLRDTIGNPLNSADVWTKKAAALESAGLIQAYGASTQPAGYWPGQGSNSDPLTGKMLDGATWPWKSSSPPFLFIAEYCDSSTRIAGQLRNAPLGS